MTKAENIGMKKTESKKLYRVIKMTIIQACLCVCSMKVVAIETPLIFPIPQYRPIPHHLFIKITRVVGVPPVCQQASILFF